MLKIWKETLAVGMNTISIPEGSQILSVGNQDDQIAIWFLFDICQTKNLVDGYFMVAGTGCDIDAQDRTLESFWFHHKGTVQRYGYVWHVFDLTSTLAQEDGHADPFKAKGRDNNPAPEEPEPGDEIDPPITYTGPADAWETIWETIQNDMRSNAFDEETKAEISEAFNAIDREWTVTTTEKIKF